MVPRIDTSCLSGGGGQIEFMDSGGENGASGCHRLTNTLTQSRPMAQMQRANQGHHPPQRRHGDRALDCLPVASSAEFLFNAICFNAHASKIKFLAKWSWVAFICAV